MMTGQEFVNRCVGSAADLALFFVGQPDGMVLASLAESQMNIAAGLADEFGSEIAAQIAAAFVSAVIGHKHELERRASSVYRDR